MCRIDGEKYESRAQRNTLSTFFSPLGFCQESGRKNLKSSAASLACIVIDFGSQWGLSAYFHGEKLILPNFSRLRRVATSVSYPEVRIRKETEIGLVQTWSTGFGQDFKTEIWPTF